jgi:YfiH family protein
MLRVYSFALDFKNDVPGTPFFAVFPFIFEGNPIEGISCGISSIFSGDMKYDKANQNRKALFAKLKLNPQNVYGLKQIHCRSVVLVDINNPPACEADGMITDDRNVTLSVTVADCLPVFLLDVKSGAFGLVHSGWKGTGIALNALNLMKERWGTESGGVAAILGPCIGSCCYKVDAERAAVFEKEFGNESVRKSGEDFYLDMKAANIRLLSDAGVKNIAVCEDCTFMDERLGSFRREGAQFTSMAALANC